MNLNDLLITNGYVCSMGKSYHTPSQDELDEAVLGAMRLSGKTREQILADLESGKKIQWCESPNFYYDHSYGFIGRRKGTAPVEMVQCDCGHSVTRGQRMSASLGTSCPDCYDRMSG